MTATTPRPKTRYMELPATRIRYLQAGTGSTTVVFATDPPNVIQHYAELVAALAPHLRVVVFEPPGFGGSRLRGRAPDTRTAQADIVASFLDGLGHGPVILAFPCLAAYVAMEVAARHPALVERLVLSQVAGPDDQRRWVERVWLRGLMTAPLVGTLASRLGKRRIAHRWYRTVVPDATRSWRFLAVARSSFREGAAFPLARALRAFQADQAPLPVVRHPTLVVWGTKDPTHRRSDRRSLQDVLRSVAFVEFDDCGHFPELEAPGRYTATLLSWLGRRPAPRPRAPL